MGGNTPKVFEVANLKSRGRRVLLQAPLRQCDHLAVCKKDASRNRIENSAGRRSQEIQDLADLHQMPSAIGIGEWLVLRVPSAPITLGYSISPVFIREPAQALYRPVPSARLFGSPGAFQVLPRRADQQRAGARELNGPPRDLLVNAAMVSSTIRCRPTAQARSESISGEFLLEEYLALVIIHP